MSCCFAQARPLGTRELSYGCRLDMNDNPGNPAASGIRSGFTDAVGNIVRRINGKRKIPGYLRHQKVMEWQTVLPLLAPFSTTRDWGRLRIAAQQHMHVATWSLRRPMMVSVHCDAIFERTGLLLYTRNAPGSHEVHIAILDSNELDWSDCWTGYVLDMPYVPIDATVEVCSDAGLVNLEVVLRRCRKVVTLSGGGGRPGSVKTDLTDHAIADLAAALERHGESLHEVTELHLPRKVAKVIATADIKSFDWALETPSHLEVFFARPRQVHFLQLRLMPPDVEAWQTFVKNVKGLRKFAVPFGSTLADLKFLWDHAIEALDVAYSDDGMTLLRRAGRHWKTGLVRLGIHFTQGVEMANMLHDFPNLSQIVWFVVDDDHSEHEADESLLPKVLLERCEQRGIQLTNAEIPFGLPDFYDSRP
eukprot:TRINITY_DN112474_c0_g1_i1.p1 TRINITY_DN112474_c0_g1~~TRINITY_DN112474_c0_g1_i1.p1  ORF type:complete len:419 (+),score=28.35 TRINITY_DN112474_c0_g1_i1:25-1281(+)